MNARRCRLLGSVANLSRWVLIGTSCMLASGCATWDKTPPADVDAVSEEDGMPSAFRKSSSGGQQLGLDERSRAIERSLGVK